MKISASELHAVLKEKLVKYGLSDEAADLSAKNFVDNSLDGVYSHGVNRFPRVISYLQKGYIKPEGKPECISSFGAFEKWDGNLGMGNTNGTVCMNRAIELAKQFGIGCVALRNTNHWMRAGAFGIQAAKAGCVGICWTNTLPNMPAWGAKDRRIGNNPLTFCVPRKDGSYVLMDGAMAQFSYGAIEKARLEGKELPYDGGFDTKGELTRDPAEIEKTWRVLPMGLWKGSGFSILLDLIASMLSDGNSTSDIGKQCEDEYGLSQLFIAIDPKSESSMDVVERVIADLKESELIEGSNGIRYPSERAQVTNKDHSENGIPVNDSIWEQIIAL